MEKSSPFLPALDKLNLIRKKTVCFNPSLYNRECFDLEYVGVAEHRKISGVFNQRPDVLEL